ncbi:YaeQ family protein [Marinimicrobium sp. C6131]|uniref:YaeQ family protein n=1 Tax=Marinimicrobium sp. C6131 TaxID=3022676 RepID=UPI00223DA251|nr:YaeQ family protein [Marinimicrobium sp. C6131]UZJ44725.1 YaeQ family protein [Marinimicrobium sp. C6131]
MATNATVIKARLEIADMNRHYYHSHALTLARHPSENDQRLMVRLLAFALNASDTLTFSSSLSSDDEEPELSRRNLVGDIELWVAFGTPDEKWLRKACNRARQVQVFAYGSNSVRVWWQQQQKALSRYRNLSIRALPDDALQQLAGLVERTMTLQFNISEQDIWVSSETGSVALQLEWLKEAEG